MSNQPKDENRQEGDRPDEGCQPNRKPKLTGERHVSGREVREAQDTNPNRVRGSVADLLSIKPGETPEQYKKRVEETRQDDSNELTLVDTKEGVKYTAKGTTALAAKEISAKGAPIEKAAPPGSHADTRTIAEKAGDFFNAAARRAGHFFTDGTDQKAYVNGLQEKMIGIAEGLNEAKEEIKKLAVDGLLASLKAGDGALNVMAHDPRAAEKAIHDLSNHIRETVQDVSGKALESMASDPHAFDKLMATAYEHLQGASDKYSHMSAREQGKVIGKFMFTMVNPEGSLEAPALAAQATARGSETLAIHAPQIAEDLAKLRAAAPDLADRAEQWLSEKLPGFKRTHNPAEDFGPRDQVKTVERHDSPEPRPELPPKTFGEFVAELENEVRNLPKKQREFLESPGAFPERPIEVEPIKRIKDRFLEVDERTGGVYDPKTHKIYVAQEVWSPSRGKFIPNDDVRFALQHEIGHAFNDNADLAGYLSTRLADFKKAYAADKAAIMGKDADAVLRRSAGHRIAGEDEIGTWEKLGLSKKEQISMASAWDEVFADMFAHSQGLTSNNPWSQMMKDNFPRCREFMEKQRYLR